MTTNLFSFVCSFLLAAQVSAMGVDPQIHWEVLETRHFKVIFDSKHYELARLYADSAEQSFVPVADIFGIYPEKTVLVLNDLTDQANGFAVGVPYPMIHAFPVLPGQLDSIGDYGNWARELITHEYTHIVSFEPALGGTKPFRYVFGSIIRPNMFLPRWYLEGIAVYAETRFSEYGRLRSPAFTAIPRALVAEDKLRKEDVARVNETSIPDWPGGIRPYLFGAMIWEEMTREKDETVVREINDAHARYFPIVNQFAVDTPPRRILGKNYQGLLDSAYERTEQRAREQIKQIEAPGKYPFRRMTQDGFYSHSPVMSPDQKKLAFIGRTHNKSSYIGVYDRGEDKSSFAFLKPEIVRDKDDGISRVSWFPDSRRLLYDAVDTYRYYYQYSDLYVYDLAEKKRKQLTKGLRAREPALSPDGQHIVFVQNYAGGTRLAMVNSEGADLQILHAPPLQFRVGHPEFLDTQTVIFSQRDDHGHESLMKLVLTSTQQPPQKVLPEFEGARFAKRTSDGLLFGSDRNGVPNLYLANSALTTARPVTNVTTTAVTGELDPRTHELLFARMEADGYALAAAEESTWKSTPQQLPQIKPLVDRTWPDYEAPKVDATAERHDYNSFRYLLPTYWFPTIWFVPGGTYFSASTAGNDPLGKQAYGLLAAYDTLTVHPSYIAQYANNTIPYVGIGLLGADFHEYIYSYNVVRHSTMVNAVAGSAYLPGLSEKWRLGTGWQYLQTDLPNQLLVRNGPLGFFSYQNVEMRGREISPEKGGSLVVQHVSYMPSTSNYAYDQTDAIGSFYFSKWLPERNAIALFANASIAPRLSDDLLGRASVGGNYNATAKALQTSMLMRGYRDGAFIGHNVVNGTFEYRFPIQYSYRGAGTTPFFLQRMHADVFADVMTLDGVYYDVRRAAYRPTKLGRYFVGTGGEVKADMTAFFHVPLTLIAGGYYGLDNEANEGGIIPFIGIGL